MSLIDIFNLYFYQFYFRVLYILAIIFSAICFNLIFHFWERVEIGALFGSTFMTFVFYIAADAADILSDIMKEKTEQALKLRSK